MVVGVYEVSVPSHVLRLARFELPASAKGGSLSRYGAEGAGNDVA